MWPLLQQSKCLQTQPRVLGMRRTWGPWLRALATPGRQGGREVRRRLPKPPSVRAEDHTWGEDVAAEKALQGRHGPAVHRPDPRPCPGGPHLLLHLLLTSVLFAELGWIFNKQENDKD